MTCIVYLFSFGLSVNSRETPSPPKTPPRGGVEPDSGHTTPRGSSWDRPLTSIIIGVFNAPGEGFWFGGGSRPALTRQDPPPKRSLSRIFPVFYNPKVLPATCTCLTQAGARASNTFWHPILGVDSRSETTDCRPTGDRKAAEWSPPLFAGVPAGPVRRKLFPV